MRSLTIPICAVFLLVACDQELSGPAPNLTPDATTGAAGDPAYTCTTLAESIVTVRGAGLAPLVVDALADEANPSVRLPNVTLRRVSTIEGGMVEAVEVPLRSSTVAAESDVRWISQQELRLRLTSEMALEPGIYDVVVANPNGQETVAPAAFGVLPRPSASAIIPELTCVAQDQRAVRIEGDHLLVSGAAQPTIRLGDKDYAPTSTDDCRDLGPVFGGAKVCKAAVITIPAADLDAGVYLATITNPAPAACASDAAAEGVQLVIVPPPTVSAIEPEPICGEQLAYDVTVRGAGFVQIMGEGAALPSVVVGDRTYAAASAADCQPIEGLRDTSAQSCAALTFAVAAGDLADMSDAAFIQREVRVVNPDPVGCQSAAPLAWTIVPPPTIGLVAPSPVCAAQMDQTITVTGERFLSIDGALPAVTLAGQAITPTLADCQDVPAAGGAVVQSCGSLSFTIAQGALPAGSYPVAVTNPDPAGCAAVEALSLELVPAPTVSAIAPSFFCADAAATPVTITGEGFVQIGAELPVVVFMGQEIAADMLADCTPRVGADPAVSECTSLTFTLPANALPAGSQPFEVRNPGVASCVSGDMRSLRLAGPPTIADAQPARLCSADVFDGSVTLTGSNFLRIGGQLPAVTVNGVAVAPTLSQCVPVPDLPGNVEDCAQLDLVVPANLRDQSLTFALVNPAPADCGVATFELMQQISPRIDTVTPLRLCIDGGSFQLTGQAFQQGMTAMLDDGTMATSVVVNPAGTQATVTFGALPTAGLYDLSVANPGGCDDVFEPKVRVIAQPRVVFADPPVVYNGINTQVRIYISGLFGGTITDVKVRDSAGALTTLPITVDPARPNTVQAVIPEGILAQGIMLDDLDVIVTDDVMCTGEAMDLVKVTDNLTVAIDKIEPPFGWTGSPTGVTITAEDPAPAGQVQFTATPRVYLNPVNAGPNTIATELRSTLFRSATELSGIVDQGLQSQGYDVIVVNPDGSVGLLPDAFDVLELPPPTVDTVSPGSWQTNNAALAIEVNGANFRDPTIEATCRDTSGVIQTAVVTVNSSTGSRVLASVNTNTLSHLAVCFIRVTNTDDGSYVEYAPISVTNPAGNFVSFQPGPDMITARRAASSASGKPSRAQTYIYAIGGDAGAPASAMTSVEASSLDRFGAPTPWFALKTALPTARTLAGAARVNDFIYLVGGHNGTGATNTVLRANVLDPLYVPNVTNVELELLEAGGPAPGVYYYRISAVLNAADAANPNGETLASDPQAIRLPGAGFTVTLSWSAIANAAEYRIYRSATPDQPFGNEQLLAVVPAAAARTFVDDGSLMTNAAERPLPVGSLGTWHQVATITTGRFDHGVTAAPDPVDPALFYLYAVGGSTGTDALGSYEAVRVTVNGPRAQTVQTITPAVTTTILSLARRGLQLLTGTSDNARYIPQGQAYLYALGGEQANGSLTRRVETARVLAGGALSLTWTNQGDAQGNRAGYAAALANNNIVLAGGFNATPSSQSAKGELCDGTGCAAPAIDQWSSLSNVNMRNRYRMASLSFNGFLYMLGGLTDNNMVTRSTDLSTLGGTP